MDWINKLHNVENKIKQQLFAKGLDNLNSYYQLLQVPKLFNI
jgi:hypothetical protein